MYYAHVDIGVLYNAACTTNVVVYLHVSWIIYMYCVWFLWSWVVYYVWLGVYLRILWIICMYKFSWYHIIVFTVFSFYLLIFDKNRSISGKNHLEVATSVFWKRGRFIGQIGWFIGVPDFYCSSIVFGVFQLNFLNFRWFLLNFSKTVEIGDFPWIRAAGFLSTPG
jgi:hypothetical protein